MVCFIKRDQCLCILLYHIMRNRAIDLQCKSIGIYIDKTKIAKNHQPNLMNRSYQSQLQYKTTRNHQVVSIRHQKRSQQFQQHRHYAKNAPPIIVQPILDQELKPMINHLYQRQYKLEEFEKYLEDAQEVDEYKMHRGAIGIRKVVDRVVNVFHQTTQYTILERLDKLLTMEGLEILSKLCVMTQYPQLMLQAAQTLANLSSINLTVHHINLLVQTQILDRVIYLLTQTQNLPIPIFQNLALMIGDLSIPHSDCKKYFIQNKVVSGIVQKLSKHQDELQTRQSFCVLIWSLTCMVRRVHQFTQQVWKGVLFVGCLIDVIIDSHEGGYLTDCLYCIIEHINMQNQKYLKLFVTSKFTNIIIAALKNDNKDTMLANKNRTQAMRIIGQLTMADDSIVQTLVDLGTIQAAYVCLMDVDEPLLIQTCWVLSNIAAGTQEQADALLAMTPVMDRLTVLLKSGCLNVQKQLYYLFSNLARRMPYGAYFQLLKKVQYVENMCQTLQEEDPKVLFGVLNALERIMKHFAHDEVWVQRFKAWLAQAGGLTHLEKIQFNGDVKVYGIVSRLINCYFQVYDSQEIGQNELYHTLSP